MKKSESINLFDDLTPFEKWWGKLKGRTKAKIINFWCRLKKKVSG